MWSQDLSRRLEKVGLRLGLLLSVVIFLAVITCKGQQVEATLSGFITDPANAAIPDVQVTVRNEATGIVVAVRSGPDGAYTVPALRAGTYTLIVEHAGFQKSVQTGIKLDVNQQARMDVHLQVGALTTTVEVAGTAPQVETATATVSATIDTTTVTELPLNIRRFGGHWAS
jgi:carboxypeptidase family protein